MKTILLPLLCISLSITAQKKDSALLQQFKFRTPNYRAVSLTGDASGTFNAVPSANSTYSLQLNPGLRATKLISTDKEYTAHDFEVQVGFSNGKSAPASGTQRQTDISTRLLQSVQTKKYKGQNYFTTGYTALLQQFYNKSTSNYFTRRNGLFTTLSYTAGFGKGRIENVTDAQMAFNILSDLKKKNLLDTDFTVADAYSLAQTITQVNNTRLFDFRRKHIFELTQIDSLLHKKGLIKDNSIAYFATVADNWFYAFNQLRKHGKEKYITLIPVFGYNNNKTALNLPVDSTVKENAKSVSAFLTLGIEKATARNIKRQFTRGIALQTVYGYGRNKYTSNTTVNEQENHSLNSSVNAFLQWGYYPNTRTNISTTLTNFLVVNYSDGSMANNSHFSFEGNYFINYNTRFYATVSSVFSVSKNGMNNYATAFSSAFNFGLQHFIR